MFTLVNLKSGHENVTRLGMDSAGRGVEQHVHTSYRNPLPRRKPPYIFYSWKECTCMAGYVTCPQNRC